MIAVDNLKKKFKRKDKNGKTTEFYAVDGITFEARKGEVLGILGPNGAGKTTLLRMIAGIMKETSGTVTVDDQNYRENPIDIKRKIAFLSGNTKLYSRISAHELLQMCGKLYEVEQETIDKNEAEIIKILGLEEIKNAQIGKLSTGQTQKVGIARCMIHDPDYYIMDEATSGLDIIASQIIMDFIKQEKQKGKGFIYSTHYMEEAENICDRVVMVYKGRVVETGTPEEIRRKTNTTNLRDAFFTVLGGEVNEE